MNKNTRSNAAAIRNSESSNIKLLNAAEILHNECGVEIYNITSAHADEYSATFITHDGKYNVIYNKDGVYVFKGDSCVFEMEISNIYTEDDANRQPWDKVPRHEKDKTYVQFEVFDLKDPEAFVNNMPWKEGVIYTKDMSLGKFGGCIHFPACDKVAEITPLFNQVIDALNIGGASYQFCEIHIHKNDEVTKIKVEDLL